MRPQQRRSLAVLGIYHHLDEEEKCDRWLRQRRQTSASVIVAGSCRQWGRMQRCVNQNTKNTIESKSKDWRTRPYYAAEGSAPRRRLLSILGPRR